MNCRTLSVTMHDGVRWIQGMVDEPGNPPLRRHGIAQHEIPNIVKNNAGQRFEDQSRDVECGNDVSSVGLPLL